MHFSSWTKACRAVGLVTRMCWQERLLQAGTRTCPLLHGALSSVLVSCLGRASPDRVWERSADLADCRPCEAPPLGVGAFNRCTLRKRRGANALLYVNFGGHFIARLCRMLLDRGACNGSVPVPATGLRAALPSFTFFKRISFATERDAKCPFDTSRERLSSRKQPRAGCSRSCGTRTGLGQEFSWITFRT